MLAVLFVSGAHADEQLWGKLRQGGYVVLIRHASTEPGIGDPPGFRLDDCRTQRSLSEAGRGESRRLGDAFRVWNIPVSEVRASQWCRCQDTARLAFGQAAPWPVLNSLFNDASREPALVAAVNELAAGVRPPRNLVLVTHNFNIRALVGVSPATAEVIVARSDGGKLQLVGRIPAP
jgi:broad specificity phosphatase PhoE